MRKQLNTKEQWFANTEEEANKIVEETKEEFSNELIGYSIQEKSNKTGEYYLVKLDMKYNTPAGIMESELVNDGNDEWNDIEENTVLEGEDE
ncbi:hypothetical protein QQG09_06485 [Melissococcus plutonius]|uniref:hypothetical protein n=1 Tax=Melissococcus plutonius TaxID=33970 RepID=UPI0021E549E3|nr:hypothetical protein [Melissococcus plutonius]MCV2499611.1 hypothetical protein [Melissococcus plutonius]MCV2501531.1 hypothetical protein [Melissococcus plutonius]MCV2505968.1 hypothetical protein [Melissococcus plutonius]MCV2508209.1 hypothetical protein [Melissococcus plutonius]MCV2520003.1 hypothetical protein [Melissococcus plutonius]